MSPFRSCLLGTYYYGTYPYRWVANRVAGWRGRAPVMVLFYHRVADEYPNGWTCGTETFRRQIDWLKAHFDLVSLDEAQRRIRGGRNTRPTVAITFDDGYADNCRLAIPLLVRERIPCTYFVSTQFVVDGTPFPHDLTAGHRLRPNTLDELREMANLGIEIGAHTRTHANLGPITDPARLMDEVVTSGEELQSAIGYPIRHFAFPYGQRVNLNPAAFQLAYEAGYEGVCSAYGGYNFPGDDAFHIQRIHADPNLLRLKNWLTVDPRECRVTRYQYEQSTVTATEHGVASL